VGAYFKSAGSDKKIIEISTAGFSRNLMVNGDGYYVGS
jgi:hypothetical protein